MDRFSAGTPTSACTPRRRVMAEVRILLASSLRCDTSFLNEDAEFFAVQASTGTSTSGLAHRSQPISITPLSTLLRPTPPPQLPPPRTASPSCFSRRVSVCFLLCFLHAELTIIHFHRGHLCGLQSTADEYGVAAYKAVEVGRAPHPPFVRLEGNSSKHFDV